MPTYYTHAKWNTSTAPNAFYFNSAGRLFKMPTRCSLVRSDGGCAFSGCCCCYSRCPKFRKQHMHKHTYIQMYIHIYTRKVSTRMKMGFGRVKDTQFIEKKNYNFRINICIYCFCFCYFAWALLSNRSDNKTFCRIIDVEWVLAELL